MKVLKSIMFAVAMLLLSANFAFSQPVIASSKVAYSKFEINIVDMSQREMTKVPLPRPPATFPVRVEILNNKGKVVFDRTTNSNFLYINPKIVSTKGFYTISIWQGKALILSTPYLEF